MCAQLYVPPLKFPLASDTFIIRTVKEFAIFCLTEPEGSVSQNGQEYVLSFPSAEALGQRPVHDLKQGRTHACGALIDRLCRHQLFVCVTVFKNQLNILVRHIFRYFFVIRPLQNIYRCCCICVHFSTIWTDSCFMMCAFSFTEMRTTSWTELRRIRWINVNGLNSQTAA